MIATEERFNSRKDEIEFYFRVMRDMVGHSTGDDENESQERRRPIETEDNSRFMRMLKSNFLLMLYNLIESCIKSGFEEIYEAMKAESVSYTQASNALRDIWSNYEISKAHKNTANGETYSRQVKHILEQVISDTPIAPILLSKEFLKLMTRNTLDAREIRDLLNMHNIEFSETNAGDKFHILTVKNKRNSLAHGEESFDEAARDLTIDDLRIVKDEVLTFIQDAIDSMRCYYDNQLYVATNNT